MSNIVAIIVYLSKFGNFNRGIRGIQLSPIQTSGPLLDVNKIANTARRNRITLS